VRRVPALVAVALLLLAACGIDRGAQPRSQAVNVGETRTEPTTTLTTLAATTTTTGRPVFTVATAEVARVAVFDEAGAAEPARTLANPNPTYGTARVFLVKEDRGDWLNVYIPVRPNGSTGWIRRSDVSLATHGWRIVVELGAHRLTAYEGTDVFLEAPVGVGTTATPTPGGLFYTTELIDVLPYQRAAYGPFAYGLSGYSEVWYDFAGGDGQFGIHGTGDPSSVGRDASNGCIRLTNDNIRKLAERLPLGVPVEIRA
jgi:lipoprotein-anchoring transpeptidase ErfK/SrfK